MSAAAVMTFLPPREAHATLSQWVVDDAHPIGSYLAPIGPVVAALNPEAASAIAGTPVVSGVRSGRKIPVVVADEHEGRRRVLMLFDPSTAVHVTPVALVFFNSVRWLMGEGGLRHTGEPLLLAGLAPGRVTVHRPDGSTEIVAAEGGVLRYDATTLTGMYRFTQRSTEVTVGVNFFDPVESNLIDPVSTWRPIQDTAPAVEVPPRTMHPLAHPLMVLLLILLFIEWWLYCARHRDQKSIVHSKGRTTLRELPGGRTRDAHERDAEGGFPEGAARGQARQGVLE